MKRNGHIVSHVGIFPLIMKVNNVAVKMGGIGGVATLQEYRGLGYMTKLMNYGIKKLRSEEYSLSILWGVGRDMGTLAMKQLVKRSYLLFH